MNEDVSKSFHCKESGCQMSFYTEQNLSVHHQSKHSKLNLEIPSKDITINFSTDLTPTPTRLLNKCEELRVFEDPYIQNINPFDEGFRNAIDNRDAGFLSASVPSTNQDTLHTPQIIPDFVARSIKDERVQAELPMQEEPENLSTTPDAVPNIPKIVVNSEPIPLLPKPNIIYAAPIMTTSAPNSIMGRTNETVKDRLKNIILSNNININNKSNNNINSTDVEGNKRMKIETDTKLNLPAILIQTVPLIAPANLIINNNNSNKFKISDSKPLTTDEEMSKKSDDNVNSTKKKSTATSASGKSDSAALKVERNRAAARRYRYKMKQQGQALREKYDKSLKEIAQLKKDITELKKLLLLHKDCEVTKRLNLTN